MIQMVFTAAMDAALESLMAEQNFSSTYKCGECDYYERDLWEQHNGHYWNHRWEDELREKGISI